MVAPIPAPTHVTAGRLVFTDCANYACRASRTARMLYALVRAMAAILRPWAASLMASLLAFCPLTMGVHGLTIDLNYDYDTNGFFDDQTVEGAKAREALEFAVRAFEPFTDPLLAIERQWWTASFTAPGTGAQVQVNDLLVPANTLVVYVGGRDLPDNQVGDGGPGGWQATPNYVEIVRNRGQGITRNTDGTAIDFGPWGGALVFDTMEPVDETETTPRDWHFDVDTKPSSGQTDLLSVAVHELAHMLGFGLSDSFDNRIVDSMFTGASVLELNGGSGVPVVPGHWASGTRSPPYENAPRAAMGASLILGSRVAFSPLDYAGLADTGWEVPAALLGLPGDVDGDLDVDGHDFMLWQRGFSLSSGAIQASGDADGDGDVDRYDGWVVRRNLGAWAPANAQTVLVQVPEPTAWNLLLSLVTVHAFLRLFKPKSGQTLLCG